MVMSREGAALVGCRARKTGHGVAGRRVTARLLGRGVGRCER